jgi:hypothetical protein
LNRACSDRAEGPAYRNIGKKCQRVRLAFNCLQPCEIKHLQSVASAINALSRAANLRCLAEAIENMERETGIEPATSSLGIQRTFVNKEQMRPWRLILTIEVHGDSAIYGKSVLKAVIAVSGPVAI